MNNQIQRLCEKCGRPATEMHHKFSQTKVARHMYLDYIHHPDNIQYLCYDCHHNKPVDKWTEIEFCMHFRIKPKSVSATQKIMEGKVKRFWI